MNFHISETLSNISSRFKYYAAIALAEDGPQSKVRAELMKDGWSFKPSVTEEEALNMIRAGAMDSPVGSIPMGRTITLSPEGQEVFTYERNRPLEQRYKQAVRTAAAKVYGITD